MKKAIVFFSFALVFAAGKTWANPTPVDTTTGPQIYQDINTLLGSPTFSSNAGVDFLQYGGQDILWQEKGGGTVTLLGLSAGNTNSLFLYKNPPPGASANVFSGFSPNTFTGFSTVNPGKIAGTGLAAGDTFSWFLHSQFTNGDTTNWDSDPSKNVDSQDHLLTYHLTDLIGKTYSVTDSSGDTFTKAWSDPYLLAWEDNAFNGTTVGDGDFNDLVAVVDRAAPLITAPEPVSTALFLVGGALLAFAFWRRRRTVI